MLSEKFDVFREFLVNPLADAIHRLIDLLVARVILAADVRTIGRGHDRPVASHR